MWMTWESVFSLRYQNGFLIATEETVLPPTSPRWEERVPGRFCDVALLRLFHKVSSHCVSSYSCVARVVRSCFFHNLS